MKTSLAILRVFFIILSLFFMTTFMISLPVGGIWQKTMIGIGSGLLFGASLFGLENFFKRYSLKAFNTLILGLFIGFLMGKALAVISMSILQLSHMQSTLQPQTIDTIKIFCFLLGTYLGAFLTFYFSEEIYLSIPFVKLSVSSKKKKDFLLDATVLNDPRIIDLCLTGIFNHSLIVSEFLIRELHSEAEVSDEMISQKAKRCLETLKNLQNNPELGLQIDETPISEGEDSFTKLLRLARLLDVNLLTSDLSQTQVPSLEGIQIIDLHALSIALKPLMQAGESIKMKIQRFGKEPNQGIGYLEDGTMVVVNGGGDYIGECIGVQVLSVKHTSSGRMIFCNTMDDLPVKGNRVEI